MPNHPPQILAELATGRRVSSAELADRMGVTGAVVQQQVEDLCARGLPVAMHAVAMHGSAAYQLSDPLQLLHVARICAALPREVARRLGALEVHWELDSTSTELQRRGGDAPDLSFVLAETQSAGRGRRGRQWLSPPGMNLYVSCLKRFDRGVAALAGLSLAVGTMLLRALDDLGIAGAGLKWPNDVLAYDTQELGGKIAGILVDLGGDYQGPCTVVIGVGLNLHLTPALREQAGQPTCDLATLNGGTPPERNRAAAAVIAALVDGLRQFERGGFTSFADDYARHDVLRGRPLTVTGALATLHGVGAGVDQRGALCVRLADGSVRTVDSADVSVRGR